jgi:hypothetical protein
MKRDIDEKLLEWKSSQIRKPLLIRGARQVGKTFSINEFAKNNFGGKYISFNFEKNLDLHGVFEKNLDTNRIIPLLELFSGMKIEPGNTLIFFDEIQSCPKAIASLRYFYEQVPELHVIAAGSLLEFALSEISFPVGRLQMLNMYPMTFLEFLYATGKELLANWLSQPHEDYPDTIIDLINNEMYSYFIIGGMPECVRVYMNTGSIIDVINTQNDLIATFRQDFSKYAGHTDKRCLNAVLNAVAAKVGEQIKYAQLSVDFTGPTIKKSFEMMEQARLYTKVRSANPVGIPLGANASEKVFKSVFLDIGLFSAMNGFSSDVRVPKNKMASAFNGKLAEQFVGQELRAKYGENLYYWSRNQRGSSAETDYLIEKQGEIFPVEVKSGKSGKLRSLHLLLKEYPNVKKAIVLTEDKAGSIPEQKIEFLPLFCAGKL